MTLSTQPVKQEHPKNWAFIDAQNIHLGVKLNGWTLDWARFRILLSDKYHVQKANIFIGYVAKNQQLYKQLESWGYTVVLKDVTVSKSREPKGNVDAELIVEVMSRLDEFDNAFLVTGDGDFAVLVRYLKKVNKFGLVLCPNRQFSSWLLRRDAAGKIVFLNEMKNKLSKTRKSPK